LSLSGVALACHLSPDSVRKMEDRCRDSINLRLDAASRADTRPRKVRRWSSSAWRDSVRGGPPLAKLAKSAPVHQPGEEEGQDATASLLVSAYLCYLYRRRLGIRLYLRFYLRQFADNLCAHAASKNRVCIWLCFWPGLTQENYFRGNIFS
jgi:hypothetical protein